MPTSPRGTRAFSAIAAVLFLLCVALGAEAAGPKRVLIIHSFGRDVAPFDVVASAFRTDLARRSREPITFVETNLDLRHSANGKEERAFREYLSARFDNAPPDAVVTIGAPAARFYLRHRNELFADAPLVVSALDERMIHQLGLAPNDAVVAGKVDLPRLAANILQLLPDTSTIAVVVGATEIEAYWRGELQREFAPLAGRVKFEWLNDLSLEEMQARVARLPPHSAVIYGLLIVDAAGVPHERLDGLARLRAVSTAPIFGLYENELGKGIVGGPYTSQQAGGERIATATLRALSGAPPQVDIIGFERPAYDWRELQRWNIDSGRLPADSEIRFKPPSAWEEHRLAVIATMAALLLQAGLIAALLLQRARRRDATAGRRGIGRPGRGPATRG